MIRKQEHIKELLRKQAEGKLTAEEAWQLKLVKLVHDDDDWLDMILDVLRELDREHPDDSLKGWRPDFAAIIKKAEQDKRN